MLYEMIKELCDEKGISVMELEKEIGFGNGTIGKWRNVSPSVANLSKVAESLGVSVGYFTDKKVTK